MLNRCRRLRRHISNILSHFSVQQAKTSPVVVDNFSFLRQRALFSQYDFEVQCRSATVYPVSE